jgi:hypothetical protein
MYGPLAERGLKAGAFPHFSLSFHLSALSPSFAVLSR